MVLFPQGPRRTPIPNRSGQAVREVFQLLSVKTRRRQLMLPVHRRRRDGGRARSSRKQQSLPRRGAHFPRGPVPARSRRSRRPGSRRSLIIITASVSDNIGRPVLMGQESRPIRSEIARSGPAVECGLCAQRKPVHSSGMKMRGRKPGINRRSGYSAPGFNDSYGLSAWKAFPVQTLQKDRQSLLRRLHVQINVSSQGIPRSSRQRDGRQPDPPCIVPHNRLRSE